MSDRMLRIVFVTIVITVFVLAVSVILFADTVDNNVSVRKIVIFRNDVDHSARQAMVSNICGGKIIREFQIINGVVLNINPMQETALRASGNIISIQEDVNVNWLDEVDNYNTPINNYTDPVAQITPWNIGRVHAPMAWRKTTGEMIRVGVVDTGVGPHPDVKIYGGVSTLDYTKSYADDNGHGTHVSGIIGATNNSIGVVGVAPFVKLYAVKAFSGMGWGLISDVVAGLEWCVVNKMNVVNMSWGSFTDFDAIRMEIEAMDRAKILMVGAAGNNYGWRIIYPAAYPQVIAVSATDAQNNLAYFSSKGPEMDMAAPGDNIYSTLMDWEKPAYGYLSGTSMAAPHVTAVVALIKSRPRCCDYNGNGKADYWEVKKKLFESARDLGPAGPDESFGNGLVNAYIAVQDLEK